MIHIKHINTLFLFFLTSAYFAQSFEHPSDYLFSQQFYQAKNNRIGLNNLVAYQNTSHNFISTDSNSISEDWSLAKNTKFFNWLLNKPFIKIIDSSDQFKLSINPIVDFRYFNSNQNKLGRSLYLNARGVAAECSFGNKLFLHTSFIENQAFLPNYLDSAYKQTKTSIGEGRYKSFKIKGYDYASAQAYLLYQALPQLAFQLGNGKQKIGTGYRSIWLSDMAFNYPYLKISFQDKKHRIQYNVLYAMLSNLSNGGTKTPISTEPLFQKKPASFQHLEWRIHKRFYMEFFQGIVWQPADSNNRLNVSLNFANPLIYSHALGTGLRNKNNVYLGWGWHAVLFKNAHLYNYFTLDDLDFKSNRLQKTALQFGLKLYDAFGLKNLFLQSEYTRVSPFAFDGYPSNTSITHYNQPLAYGLQSNNEELVNLLSYRFKRFFIEGELSIMRAIKTYDQNAFATKADYAQYLNLNGGFNPLSDEGKNTIATYNTIPKMYLKNRAYLDLKCGFIVNPHYLLTLHAGVTVRQSNNFFEKQTERIVYFGLSTRLYQKYWDN